MYFRQQALPSRPRIGQQLACACSKKCCMVKALTSPSAPDRSTCREAGAVEGPCASSYAARVLCCCFCKLCCTIQQIRWPSSCLGAMRWAQSQQSLESVCMSCIDWKHHSRSWRARWPVRCFSPLSRQQPAPLRPATGPGETPQMDRRLHSLSHCSCSLGSSPQQGRHICGTAYGRPGGARCLPCGTEWPSGAPCAPLPQLQQP